MHLNAFLFVCNFQLCLHSRAGYCSNCGDDEAKLGSGHGAGGDAATGSSLRGRGGEKESRGVDGVSKFARALAASAQHARSERHALHRASNACQDPAAVVDFGGIAFRGSPSTHAAVGTKRTASAAQNAATAAVATADVLSQEIWQWRFAFSACLAPSNELSSFGSTPSTLLSRLARTSEYAHACVHASATLGRSSRCVPNASECIAMLFDFLTP